MGIVQRIIKKQPNFIKKIYYNIVPFKKRYGSVYGETVNFLNDLLYLKLKQDKENEHSKKSS